MRGRQARLLFFKQVARMAHAGVFLFVIAPLDLATLGGFGVPGVAQIGRVALVAQKRVANVFTGACKFQIGFEKGQRVIHRHDGQVFSGHVGNQATPQAGTHHHVVSGNKTFGGFHALDAAVFNAQPCAGGVGKRLQLARGHCRVHQLARHHLGAGFDQAGVRIPQRALHHALVQQWHFGFGFGGTDQLHPVAKGFARGHAALEFLHTLVVPHPRYLDAADAVIAAHLLVKVDAVLGGEDGHLIVHRVEAKIRSMGGGTHVGGNGGFVDTDDVVPATFNQMVRHRSADDAALADDDDLGAFRKLGHVCACSYRNWTLGALKADRQCIGDRDLE